MSESALKITQVPAAFAELAGLHNALVDLIKTATGQGGIKVVVSDGRIIIDGSAVSGSATGNSVSVVAADGTLSNVVAHSNTANANTYPTTIKVINGTTGITLDSSGFTMSDSNTGKSFTISFSALSQNIAIRTDTYCDSGYTKNIQVVASSPY